LEIHKTVSRLPHSLTANTASKFECMRTRVLDRREVTGHHDFEVKNSEVRKEKSVSHYIGKFKPTSREKINW